MEHDSETRELERTGGCDTDLVSTLERTMCDRSAEYLATVDQATQNQEHVGSDESQATFTVIHAPHRSQTNRRRSRENEVSGPAQTDRDERGALQLYLADVGTRPLLSVPKEKEIARELAEARTSFINTMLRSDYMLREVTRILDLVGDGSLRLDRTVNMCVVDEAKKRSTKSMLEPGIRSLRECLRRNGADFRSVIDRRQLAARRRKAWHDITRRRADAASLVRQIDLRMHCFDPLLSHLIEIDREMQALKEEVDQFRKDDLSQQEQETRI